MPKNSATCRYCGARIVRRNPKVTKKMAINSRIAMFAGAVLILVGGMLVYNQAWIFGGTGLAVGLILFAIGRMTD